VSQPEQPDDPALPPALRAAVAVVGVQAVGLLGLALFLVAKTLVSTTASVAGALLGAGFAVLGGLILGACARGLRHARPAARTPVVVLELLSLPVGYSLAFQAGRVAYGAPILVLAVTVLYLLFTPPARALLDRERGL
jgi:hypothetical protein